MNRFYLLTTIILVVCMLNVQAQIVESHLVSNSNQAADYDARIERVHGSIQEKSLVGLPFIDDFSKDHFPGNQEGNTVLWETLDAYRNLGFGVDPPSVGVVTFDGLKADGSMYSPSSTTASGHADTLQSVEIDLEGTDNVVLSFFFQPQGLGEAPDANDSLTLSFYSPTQDQWSRVWFETGTIIQPFEHVLLEVDTAFRHDGFQFRFINYGGLAGSLDLWHLDYIHLDENRSINDGLPNDVGFLRPEFTLLKDDYTAVPWTHYQEFGEQLMKEVIPVQLRNNRDLGALINSSGYSVDYEGINQATFIDPQSPSVASESNIEIIQEVALSNDFSYDINVNDTCAAFDVTFEFSTSPDEHSDNNSYSFTQAFHNYYSYDDGEAERGFGFGGTTSAKLAYRFDILKSDSLRGVELYLLPTSENVEDEVLFIRIWEDDGGVPGELIYQDNSPRELSYSELNEFVLFPLDSAIFIPAGPVHIGFGQTTVIGSVLNINLGNDKNGNSIPDRLRFDVGSGWVSTSVITGTLMIHPVFVSLRDNLVSISEQVISSEDIKAWPLPARDLVTIELPDNGSYEFTLFDMYGKAVRRGKKNGTRYAMYVQGLPKGLYVLDILDTKQGLRGHKKIMIGA